MTTASLTLAPHLPCNFPTEKMGWEEVERNAVLGLEKEIFYDVCLQRKHPNYEGENLDGISFFLLYFAKVRLRENRMCFFFLLAH